MHTITLPDRRVVSVGAYARAIRLAKDNPDTWYYNGPHGGGYGRDIYNRFRLVTLHDIINQRGRVNVRECNYSRLIRKRQKHLTLTCAECGQPAIPQYSNWTPGERSFCSIDCARAYRGYW